VSGVKEGTEILVDFNISGGEAPQQNQASNPFMPRPRNNRQNNQQKK
jgi:HlyD family secretion protein